jgi:integrase
MIAQPSQGPVSALRARMIEDMRVRGFTEKTRNDYVRNVRALAVFIGRSPDTATAEDLRRFQLHQTQIGMQPPSINSAVAALRFFFTVTLDRPDLARRLTIVREPRRLPAVLSVEEVTLLLHAAPGPKYKAALATAGACPRAGRRPDPWGAGLRVSEVVAAQGRRYRFRAHAAAGRAPQGPQEPAPAKAGDRNAMLSPQLLPLPASRRCCPAASNRTPYAVDQAKIALSTAAGAPDSPPQSSIRRRLPRPAHPQRKPPHRQIPIDGKAVARPPRVPSWEAFGRRPSARADRSRRAGVQNPSP